MEKKATQRIIGFLVVIALVVILMPFAFNGKTSESLQTAEAKTSDLTQAMEESAIPVSQSHAMIQKIDTPSENVAVVDTNSPIAVADKALDTSASVDKEMQSKSTIDNSAPAAPAMLKTADKSAKVVNVKKSDWVVQVGSFKNKNNAERLAKKLKASGFSAFTKTTKSNNQTLVLVGPLPKQTASTLVNKIEEKVKVHGVLVSYSERLV